MNVRPDHHCESSNEVLIDVIHEYGMCVFVISHSICDRLFEKGTLDTITKLEIN